MSKTTAKDVEMKDEESKTQEAPSTPKPVPLTPAEEIKANITLIERAVSTLEPRFTNRVLRGLTHSRRKVNEEILREVINDIYKDSPTGKSILGGLSGHVSESSTMEIDFTSTRSGQKPSTSAEPLPETEIYLRLLILYYIIDSVSNLPRKRSGNPENTKLSGDSEALHARAVAFGHATVERIRSLNRRSLDPISAKVWFALGRVYEIKGNLPDLRLLLLDAQRTASLRHDIETLATLINLILRSYLLTSSYDAASTFLSKAAYPDSSLISSTTPHGATTNGTLVTSTTQLLSNSTSSPTQLARYLYYVGRIRAIELSYTAAHNHLLQAVRRAPKAEQAPGFWQEVHKWLVVVELLMGDIPERGTFRHPVLRKALEGYFEIVKAVRTGSLSQFQNTLSTYSKAFNADKTYTFILRLRQNVIKTGIRRLSLAYSRISLREICVKLHLDSEEDAEYIVGKAIRDGVIEGRIVHERGWLECGSQSKGAYGVEVTDSFNRRVGFCMQLHNESVKAMRYPLNAHRKELAAAEGAREREKELAKEIQEGDIGDDSDLGDF
ncbi:hypothetical protein Clacol_009357 [Clathrus columnatus]|uniref:PCI domain-containing protein n=1 Tax=Clathrus columnatus TaxID=1419009 RepID=A0AAV5AMR7_9AGAM|nr:hypothetical protein Clacol_009357 [Clathrus columnatus]